MKLYYCRCRDPNFGDELNPWLWPRVLPDVLDDNEEVVFLGIGTLLTARIPAARRYVVFGSGAGRPDVDCAVDDRWTFYCVRGPLTARAMGLAQECAVTDPAILIRTLDLGSCAKTHHVSLMPHYASNRSYDWRAIAHQLDMHFIDATWPVDRVLQSILGSDLLVTDAMHGAIVGDALRVPWMAFRAYRHTNEFKWRDWTASLGMEYRPVWLPPVWTPDVRSAASVAKCNLKLGFIRRRLRALVHSGKAQLSGEAIVNAKCDILRDRLKQLVTCEHVGAAQVDTNGNAKHAQ